jgi:hypothetical protein
MPEMKEMLGIREVLQSVEDSLIDNGWDEINVHRPWPIYMADGQEGGGD